MVSRAVVLLMLCGCGRVGFASHAASGREAGIDARPEAGRDEADARPDRDAMPDVEPAVDALPEVDARVDATPMPDADAAVMPDADVDAEPAPDGDADPTPDAMSDADADAMSDADGMPDADATSDAAPDAMPDPLEDGLLVWLPMDAVVSGELPPGGATSFSASCGTSCPAVAMVDGQTALVFDGVAEPSIPYDAAFDLTGAFTVSAYVHAAAGVLEGAVVSRQGSTREIFAVRIESSSTLMFSRINESCGSCSNGAQHLGTVALDRWVHVAVTYQGGGEFVQLFLDGTPSGVGSFSSSGPLPFTPGPLLVPGPVYMTPKFRGAMRDLRIYDRLLSSTEIGTLASRR